ncbi:MAG: response regulator transcription factor [Lachnospiraceae bacterium]|nr:response regulator transcription factor [Lachnospiraceae bacterium]
MKLLIIEDEKTLAEVIGDCLIDEGYDVKITFDGDQGYEEAMSHTYDLILLDRMLPGVDGIELLKTMRENSVETPVLILTAKSEIKDRVEGLDAGADDYMTKPFEMEELLARIRAIIRRNYGTTDDMLEFQDIVLDTKSGELECTATKKNINITGKELLVLEYLMMNKGQVLSRSQISERVWGEDKNLNYNNVEAYISFVRRKLKFIGADVEINARRGLGYLLEKKS